MDTFCVIYHQSTDACNKVQWCLYFLYKQHKCLFNPALILFSQCSCPLPLNQIGVQRWHRQEKMT